MAGPAKRLIPGDREHPRLSRDNSLIRSARPGPRPTPPAQVSGPRPRPSEQAIAHAAPQARFMRSASTAPATPAPSKATSPRLGIFKGEASISPINPPHPAKSEFGPTVGRLPKTPMAPDLSQSNAHGYMSDMASAAHGSPARPGYTRPVLPKT